MSDVPDVTCAPISEAQSGPPGVAIGIGIVGVVAMVVADVLLLVASSGAAALSAPSLAAWAVVMIASCAAAIAMINTMIAFFFHYKLACIDGDRCAIGQVMKIELNADGDTSFNMKLAPVQAMTTPAEFQASFQGSTLVFSDPGAASRGWVFRPESGAGFLSDQQQIPLFHCEIEGSFINEWLNSILTLLYAILAMAVAALALAVGLFALEMIPIIGWIIAILQLLIALFGLILGLTAGGDASSQDSADPNIPVGKQVPGEDGPILTDLAGHKVAVGDFIVLTGLHILDCGHATDKNDDGSSKGTWCELHPVRAIAKISQRIYDDVSKAPDHAVLDRFCAALTQFLITRSDGATATAQQPLEHETIG